MATQVNEQPFLNFAMKFEMSATCGALMAALAKARKGFKPVIKSETNPFFKSKYADLAAVIDATKDALSDNQLAVLQPPAFDRTAGLVTILTILGHSSGEWLKTTLEMPVTKSDAQGVGSAITYGRRYAYSAILNVASEEDDDANGAVSNDWKKKPHAQESSEEFDQRTESQQAIAVFQIQAIDEACKRTGKTEEEIAAYLGLIGHNRIEHVLRSEFNEFIKWANSKPKAKGPANVGTQALMKKLFAVAGEYSIPEDDVKRASYEKYNVKSMNDLTPSQLTEMTEWVKSVAERQTGD